MQEYKLIKFILQELEQNKGDRDRFNKLSCFKVSEVDTIKNEIVASNSLIRFTTLQEKREPVFYVQQLNEYLLLEELMSINLDEKILWLEHIILVALSFIDNKSVINKLEEIIQLQHPAGISGVKNGKFFSTHGMKSSHLFWDSISTYLRNGKTVFDGIKTLDVYFVEEGGVVKINN